MKVKTLLISLAFLCLSYTLQAQFNVEAHYANGQIWVTWERDMLIAPPETFEIYRGKKAFSSTTEGHVKLVGRLFEDEWTPFALRTQLGILTNYRIPDGMGGTITLPNNKGLFVATVQADEHLDDFFYAVVAHGMTAVSTSNISGPVIHHYSPSDPPICHLQNTFAQPNNYFGQAYYMWADGRYDENAGRPDFQVMANEHKNGMPSFFIVSYKGSLRTQYNSMTHWLHGGHGTAHDNLPNDKPGVDLTLANSQLLVSHNDDFIRYIFNEDSGFATLSVEPSNSWWFGWTREHDPFNHIDFPPGIADTIINYTQRRILWINNWVKNHYHVDPRRISIQGHSVGAAGALALAKAFPYSFSTATLFNCGFQRASGDNPAVKNLFHDRFRNLPTNLKLLSGATVHINEVFTLNDPISIHRDFPIINVFNGTNDVSETMGWTADVIAQYREADSLGWGCRLYWDERGHGIASPVGLGSFWSMGLSPDQTRRDDVMYQGRYLLGQSFPAIHDLRPPVVPGNADPAVDPNGTWAGHYDWGGVVDQYCRWEAVMWLNGTGMMLNPVDFMPNPVQRASVAVRKPNLFRPSPGTTLFWELRNETTGVLLRSGTTSPGSNGLVKISDLPIIRFPNRVRLIISCDSIVQGRRLADMGSMPEVKLFPNPADDFVHIHAGTGNSLQAVRIIDPLGKTVFAQQFDQVTQARISLIALAKGLYMVEIKTDEGILIKKLQK